jgi:hypothetical protein
LRRWRRLSTPQASWARMRKTLHARACTCTNARACAHEWAPASVSVRFSADACACHELMRRFADAPVCLCGRA